MSSPIDTVMAAGWATQLSAEARDDSGETIPTADFVWRSSNANAATVSSSGVVDGLSPGTSTIEAEAGDALGFMRMRVVPADLPTIAALLGDSFTESLVEALDAEAREAMEATLEDCLAALDDGHILNVHACLAEIPGESATEPTDQVLLAVIGVIAARSDEFLGM